MSCLWAKLSFAPFLSTYGKAPCKIRRFSSFSRATSRNWPWKVAQNPPRAILRGFGHVNLPANIKPQKSLVELFKIENEAQMTQRSDRAPRKGLSRGCCLMHGLSFVFFSSWRAEFGRANHTNRIARSFAQRLPPVLIASSRTNLVCHLGRRSPWWPGMGFEVGRFASAGRSQLFITTPQRTSTRSTHVAPVLHS